MSIEATRSYMVFMSPAISCHLFVSLSLRRPFTSSSVPIASCGSFDTLTLIKRWLIPFVVNMSPSWSVSVCVGSSYYILVSLGSVSVRSGSSWSFLGCHGSSWFILVRSWFVLVHLGLSWFILVCLGPSLWVLVRLGPSWSALVLPAAPNQSFRHYANLS